MKKSLLILLLLPIFIFAEEINLSTTSNKEYILNKSSIYIDKDSKLQIKQIYSKKFAKIDKNKIEKGFTKDSVWIKIKIKNNSNKYQKRVLTTDNYIINSLYLYTKENSKFEKRSDGIFRKNFSSILRPFIEIELLPNQTTEYIVNISSDTTPLNFSLLLMNKDTLYEEEFVYQLLLTLFFGSILTLIIYNLMIYIFSRDIAYVYYVLYLSSLFGYYLYYSNMLFYIIGFSPNFMGVYFLSLMILFIILFMKEFLNLKTFPKINKFLNIIIVFIALVCIITNENFYPIDILIPIYLSILLAILFIGYYLLKKVHEAKYFVLGWTIAVIGFINLAFYNLGITNMINYFPLFYEGTIFLEGIIFSIALVNKLNTTKKLALEVQKNKILIKEIHHRVKNNMQFIVSLYRIKLNKTYNESTSKSLDEIENIIHSMGKAYEMLYKNKNLEYIDINEYLNALLEELKISFNMKHIKIDTYIDTDLNINNAITCGIIINEAVTNSLKYAFKNYSQNKIEGKIEIFINKPNKKHIILIKDNGSGFNNKKKDGFGLHLLKSLVSSNLKGELQINSNTNGVEIKIEF